MAEANRANMKESRLDKNPTKNSNGFTLIEVVAVLTIIGILASITARRVIALETTAVQQSFQWAVSELNTREVLTWSVFKISNANWVDDLQLYAGTDYDLGPDHTWDAKSAGGGTLHFKDHQIALQRSPSTSSKPGAWSMK